MTLFWQNLLKTVCFGQNGFSLGTPGKNRRFCQNSSTCRGFVIVIVQVFWSKLPQIRSTHLCCTQNTYGTLKGRYQVNLQEKINHIQSLSEFSETEATNPKTLASFSQDAIHFHPRHLQPKTLIFTITALVE